jgi:hypothetical protein
VPNRTPLRENCPPPPAQLVAIHQPPLLRQIVQPLPIDLCAEFFASANNIQKTLHCSPQGFFNYKVVNPMR